MMNSWIIISCLIILAAYIVDTRVIPTECCMCDDESTDATKRCSYPGVCDHHFHRCDFCETRKQFVNKSWRIRRRCGYQNTCINNWYHTVQTLGCIDNSKGEPDNGTTCYYCCGSASVHTPRECQRNPDVNFIPFNITTNAPTTRVSTTKKPTTTTTTTTTPASTTTTKTTTPAAATTTTTTTTTTSGIDKDRFCMVGENGVYRLTQCDVMTPFCMNTVVVGMGVPTIIKKSCETQLLCDHDWLVWTRHTKECLKKDVSQIPELKSGVVCHYCCQSTNWWSACNNNDIPADVAAYIANNTISGAALVG